MARVGGNGRLLVSGRGSLALADLSARGERRPDAAILAALATLACVAALAHAQGDRPLPVGAGAPSAPAPTAGIASADPPSGSAKTRGRVLGAYQKLPLSFVPNAGQIDARARYYAQGNGFDVYFTPERVLLSLTK